MLSTCELCAPTYATQSASKWAWYTVTIVRYCSVSGEADAEACCVTKLFLDSESLVQSANLSFTCDTSHMHNGAVGLQVQKALPEFDAFRIFILTSQQTNHDDS